MKNNNRRDFYRIKDRAYVDYHLIGDDKDAFPSDHFHHPIYLELMNELSSLDIESNRLLSHIPENERTSAALFRVINKKIDMIARTLAIANSSVPIEDIQDIDISEGGIGFHCKEPLQPGQLLALRVILEPAYFSITTKATVVGHGERDHITAPTSKPYWIRANFLDLDDKQQQLLARHILKCQQHLRRQKYND